MKNILFDLDGTLLDSSQCIYSVFRELFSELGIPFPDETERRRLIGPTVEDSLSRYYDGDVDAVTKRFREIYRGVDLQASNRLYDGVTELLSSLQQEGYKLYLATSKHIFFTDKIIKLFDIEKYFTGIYASDDNTGRSAKGKVINAIFSRENIKREQSVLVGDTVFDVLGAREAGVSVAVVRYGFGDPTELNASDAVFFADTVQEVGEKIRALPHIIK